MRRAGLGLVTQATPVFIDLNRCAATTHSNGQSVVDIDRNRATGEPRSRSPERLAVRREVDEVATAKAGRTAVGDAAASQQAEAVGTYNFNHL